MNKHKSGFTVVELISTIVILGLACLIFFNQKNNIEAISRDKTRKTAINAMYYNLEKVFFLNNSYYPRYINEQNLTAIDPDLFIDPNGINLNDNGSDYSYIPIDCDNDKCQGYNLKANLEKEEDYIKTQD